MAPPTALTENADPAPLQRSLLAVAGQVAVARRAVAEYAERHGASNPANLVLAVSEAVSNAVVHAYVDAPAPGHVEIELQRHLDDGLILSVTDHGHGMRPRTDSPGMGVGLPLIATLAERFEVEAPVTGGTRLCMWFPAGSPGDVTA